MDEHEEQVLGMLDDLAAVDAVPESIKMMNEAARRSVAAGALMLGPFSRMVLDSNMPRGRAELRDGDGKVRAVVHLDAS